MIYNSDLHAFFGFLTRIFMRHLKDCRLIAKLMISIQIFKLSA